ncbi:MAG: chromosome segregation protein SMC [Burkholderiales bacterium]
MRLSEIKLAGFKSFVDPTHIPIPGDLVGVVGPNGCGKSNVIDAVRWVLGESRATALRGETMQDVIFNGSANRKPVARASVELIFDNSAGRVGGPWAAYSEISIKRVLVRNGDSAYYINNQHVRRRDVADIFLGTGLSSRAYAIIEQGMISRVVDAKPEELRIFLEEAAGVSKYRERRRETELRLADTRHNLARVTDILRELGERLSKLETQAEVARQFTLLNEQSATTQNLIWLMRKRDAAANRARLLKEAARLDVELEAHAAKLTETETALTRLREAHFAATGTLDSAQGQFYAANAEVAAIEQRLQFLRETRRKLEEQVAGKQAAIDLEEERKISTAAELSETREEFLRSEKSVEMAASAVAEHERSLAQAEASWREAQGRFEAIQQSAQTLKERMGVEQTHRDHSLKILQQLAARRERLSQEQGEIIDEDTADRFVTELAQVSTELLRVRDNLSELESEAPGRIERLAAADESVKQRQSEITQLQARLEAIQQIQQRLDGGENSSEWIVGKKLSDCPRLWQCIDIKPGWEIALEAVLRERLNGIAVPSADLNACLSEPPPFRIALANRASDFSADVGEAPREWPPLKHFVALRETRLSGALGEWLHGIYAVEDIRAAVAAQPGLPPGVVLVCREGHVFTRHSVSFYTPDLELHGVIERHREIEQLRGDLKKRINSMYHERIRYQALEQKAGAQRRETERLSALEDELKERLHALEVESLKHRQEAARARARKEQIAQELAEVIREEVGESGQKDIAGNRIAASAAALGEVEQQMKLAKSECEIREHAYAGEREFAEATRANHQQAIFARTLVENKIKSVEETVKALAESRLEVELKSLLEQASGLDDDSLSGKLGVALDVREQKEHILRETRNSLEIAAASLREKEQERVTLEQGANPLREAISGVRLKEQEARLTEEQYAAQLAGADEEALAALLERGTRISILQNELARLKEEIETLGLVNLAALDELNSERERKTYLGSQANDLTEAVETLENAIRRIDRETRERLQQTFADVNRHFAEMFPALFGGGQARLILTGEEILDSGVQILAQPPGKKNASIHLLSGGEKALSALALVFSLFKLNPAPFCVLDEVDAPLDDTNTERFCSLIKSMAAEVQFLFITHNKITMEIARRLIGVTMPELGVSRVVAVDIEQALKLTEEAAA